MHVLTVGITSTGKSNLNKRLAFDAIKRGQNVVVYDPGRAIDWPDESVKFSSPELFLQHVEKCESSHVFIDEAKTLWDYDIKRADKLLYRGRHRGLLLYLIAQRTRMIPPNARNMCSRVFAFYQQRYDAKILCDEYGEEMMTSCELENGYFLYTVGRGITKGKLDYSNGLPPVITTQESIENKQNYLAVVS